MSNLHDEVTELLDKAKAGDISMCQLGVRLKKVYTDHNQEAMSSNARLEHAIRLVGFIPQGKCKFCGQPTKLVGFSYKDYCSSKCGTKGTAGLRAEQSRKGMQAKYGVDNPFQLESVISKNKKYTKEHRDEIVAKRKATSLSRYGVENPAMNKDVRAKMAATNLERYGVENAAKAEEIRARIKAFQAEHKTEINEARIKGTQDKHGVVNVYQLPEVRAKSKATMMARYGVEHALQCEELRTKVAETCMARYGVANVYASEEVKAKLRQRWLDRYGVKHPMQAEEVKQKARQANLEHYGYSSFLATPECQRLAREALSAYPAGVPGKDPAIAKKIGETVSYKQRLRSVRKLLEHMDYLSTIGYIVDDRDLAIKNHLAGQAFSIRHEACGTMFSSFGKWYKRIIPCPTCKASIIEQRVAKLVQSIDHTMQVVRNDRSVLKPYEIDILVPKAKLGIEVNGDYWHSTNFKAENYHQTKHELAYEKGIKLVQLFEHELVNKPEIIASMIKQRLGTSCKLGARKLRLGIVPVQERIAFFNENHLQGDALCKVAIGLYMGSTLMYCMSFSKPRFDKRADWELIRAATKLGYVVSGGASRVLKHFESEHKPKLLLSYADARYSQGNVYKLLGFELHHLSQPNYWYWKGDERVTRYQAQKHRLPELLGDGFDPLLSESENMRNSGWHCIYDCGNYVFYKEYA